MEFMIGMLGGIDNGLHGQDVVRSRKNRPHCLSIIFCHVVCRIVERRRGISDIGFGVNAVKDGRLAAVRYIVRDVGIDGTIQGRDWRNEFDVGVGG